MRRRSVRELNFYGAYLSYGHRPRLKDVKHRLLLDLGKSSTAYQGLAFVARRPYVRQNPRLIDGLLSGIAESIAFVKEPAHKEEVLKSLQKNLRFKNLQQAKPAYEALQWLYAADMKPTLPGIQNVARLLSASNPKMSKLRLAEMIDRAPLKRLESTNASRKFISGCSG